MPVQTIFENLGAGLSVKEITEVFDVTEQEVKAVLHFAARSLDTAPAYMDENIVVLGNQQWPDVKRYLDRVVEAVNAAPPSSYTEAEIPHNG